MYLKEETWNKLKELRPSLELASTNRVIEHIIESYLAEQDTNSTRSTEAINPPQRQSVFQ